MDNLMKVLEILFKEVSVNQIIEKEISYKKFDIHSFMRLGNAHMKYYSNNELENLYYYLQHESYTFRRHMYDMNIRESQQDFNVFDALFIFAEKVLKEDGREPLCRYKYLNEWRRMSLALGEDVFITAYLAAKDAYHGSKRDWFFWKIAISTDNTYLKKILEKGLAENHFHLKGSAPSFDISWISLMNHILDYSFKTKLDKIDKRRLHHTISYDFKYPEDALWILALQAALIRAYLFCAMEKWPLIFGKQVVSTRKIEAYIQYEMISSKKLVSKDKVLEALNENTDCRMTLGELFRYLLNQGKGTEELKKFFRSDEDTDVITKQIYRNILMSQQYTREFFLKWEKEDIDMRTLFRKSLSRIKSVKLEHVQELLHSEEYYQLCEKESADYIHNLLQNPKRLIDEAENIQDIIHQISDNARKKIITGERHEYHKLDYFLLPIIGTVQQMPGYKALLAGERYFLYRYLRYAYTRKESKDKLLNLFYRYIVIKNRIWDELIQTNGNVGFNNFLQYQDRKEEFIEGTIYEKYFLQLAVAGTMTSSNIKRLEARIAPKESAVENHRTILKQNKRIKAAFVEEFQNDVEKQKRYMDSIFYVYHFIKEKDKGLEVQVEDNMLRCRHYEKRRQVYRQSMALSNLREQYYESAKYIYGIDAASEEILCRPEVFAQAFRYLKNHVVSERYVLGKKYPGLPNLKVTYHVGEDFLDLVDGLRAIDEALYFLDMQCGDRLGHALALGIDVQGWYESKRYKVVLSQQEYLDNLAWLYGKIRKFHIMGFEDVKMYIEKEFDEFFRIVYLNNINEGYLEAVVDETKKTYYGNQDYLCFARNGFKFDINSYYDAWKLRCDNPECYVKGFFENDEVDSKWNEYSTNKRYPENYKIRYNPAAAFIYHCYHYVPEVKRCGAERIEKDIPINMIRCIVTVQKEMQNLVAAKGICIECNPSSNQLIGTFHDYKKHPISKFYNKELTVDKMELDNAPQISVSINTDDQGVFYTSLENEYALIALALEKTVNEDGSFKYNRMRIYDWIDAVREMGLLQSFKPLGESVIGKHVAEKEM